eukprot:968496-Prymnesium_polylepis.1
MRLFADWCDCSCILTAGRSAPESGHVRLTRFRGTTCDERSFTDPFKAVQQGPRQQRGVCRALCVLA